MNAPSNLTADQRSILARLTEDTLGGLEHSRGLAINLTKLRALGLVERIPNRGNAHRLTAAGEAVAS